LNWKAALMLVLLFFAATGSTITLNQSATKLDTIRFFLDKTADADLQLQGEPIDGPTGPH